MKNIYFNALKLVIEIQSHFGKSYRDRKLSLIKFLFQKYRLNSLNKSLCKNSAITAYLEINLEGKFIFQEDKITQHCRQKGRNDLQQGKNEECSFFFFFYQLCGTKYTFSWAETSRNIFFTLKKDTQIMIIILCSTNDAEVLFT